MSRLMASGALIAALLVFTAFSPDAAVRARHHPHRLLFAPGVVVVTPNWPADLGLGPSGGDFFTRDNGHFNSMSNDFGTSGVLGHTNGMPAGASTYIYH
jgi:hypothetical protein